MALWRVLGGWAVAYAAGIVLGFTLDVMFGVFVWTFLAPSVTTLLRDLAIAVADPDRRARGLVPAAILLACSLPLIAVAIAGSATPNAVHDLHLAGPPAALLAELLITPLIARRREHDPFLARDRERIPT